MTIPNLASVDTIYPYNKMGNLGDTNRTTMVDVTEHWAAKVDTILIANAFNSVSDIFSLSNFSNICLFVVLLFSVIFLY